MIEALSFIIGGLAAFIVSMVVTLPWERRRTPRGTEAPEPGTTQPMRIVDAALDALPIGVVIFASDGTEILRNEAAHLDGVRHHQVLVDELVESMVDRIRSGEVIPDRVVDLHGQRQRVMALSIHALSDGGAVATVADITERVRLNQIRTDFVANLSHELKTPVGAISVLAETVADLLAGEDLRSDDRAAAARLAEKMVAESHRMSRSINELLELSRIELEGIVTWSETPAELLVGEAVERVRSLAEPGEITVTTHLPTDPLMVHGDARQLISALGNLLENAVKYSDRGSSVEVEVVSNAQHTEFRVRDHGVGIPARDLERIFERFYRVDRARSRNTGGTGLGLAIVRHVATNHGGTVAVTSTEGEGSTFVLTIPCTDPRPEEDR